MDAKYFRTISTELSWAVQRIRQYLVGAEAALWSRKNDPCFLPFIHRVYIVCCLATSFWGQWPTLLVIVMMINRKSLLGKQLTGAVQPNPLPCQPWSLIQASNVSFGSSWRQYWTISQNISSQNKPLPNVNCCCQLYCTCVRMWNSVVLHCTCLGCLFCSQNELSKISFSVPNVIKMLETISCPIIYKSENL